MAQPAVIESIPLSPELRMLLLTKIEAGELENWGKEALVVEAIRGHVISRRRGATLLGITDPEDRESFFERHELFLEYTVEMFERDLETLESLRVAK